MRKIPDHFLLICALCEGKQTATKIREHLTPGLSARYAVRMVPCMAGCTRPATVGFQAAGKAHYLFGDIESQADLQALRDFAEQYENSKDGWTNATERPCALLDKTLSRMPRLHHEADT